MKSVGVTYVKSTSVTYMKSGGVTYEECVGVTYGAHRGLGRIHFPDQQTVIT